MNPDSDAARTVAGRTVLNDDDGRFIAFAFAVQVAPSSVRVTIDAAAPIESRDAAVLDFIRSLVADLPPG